MKSKTVLKILIVILVYCLSLFVTLLVVKCTQNDISDDKKWVINKDKQYNELSIYDGDFWKLKIE